MTGNFVYSHSVYVEILKSCNLNIVHSRNEPKLSTILNFNKLKRVRKNQIPFISLYTLTFFIIYNTYFPSTLKFKIFFVNGIYFSLKLGSEQITLHHIIYT